MPKVSFGAEVGSWDHFNRSLRDKELPPVAEEQRLVLETAAREAMALKAEQLRLRAAAQGASRRLGETIARGRQAESRLRAYLKAAYGATSLELIKHGLKPRPLGRFRETPETTPGIVAPGGAALPGGTAAALPGEAAAAEEVAGAAMPQEAPATLPGAALEAPEPAASALVAGEPVPTKRRSEESRRAKRE